MQTRANWTLTLGFSLTLALSLAAGCSETPRPERSTDLPATSGEVSTLPEKAVPPLRALATKEGLHEDMPFRLRRDSTGPAGVRHIHVAQTVHGVPVWGAEAIVHLDANGALRGITNDLQPKMVLDTTPDFSAEDAVALASRFENLSSDAEPEAELYALRHHGQDHLVWKVQLSRLSSEGATPTRPVVFVDAHSGDVVFRYENLQTDAAEGTGIGTYTGNVALSTWEAERGFTLEDPGRGLGITTHTFHNGTTRAFRMHDRDNDWSDPRMADPVEVHANLSATYDYYLETFGRDGPDGKGGPGTAPSVTGSGRCLTAFTDYGRSYVNAFWDGIAALYFGDGDGVSSDPLLSPDIVGHEFTHGVTQFSAGLIYDGESGGLNEAMSDIFGGMVERQVRGEDGEGLWLVGEEVWTPGIDGDALRSMSDPSSDGVSLDYWTRSAGSEDVHYSSGIANLAFYLLSEGGSHPRLGGDAMTGIGSEAAAQIFYTALTSYMTASTDFADARDATISAAEDLYGAGSTEVSAVEQAWSLVGVDSAS